MLDSLDAIIATGALVLGISLIVQAVQQIMKQWLDLKSHYMRFQLLSIFDSGSGSKDDAWAGMKTVNALAEKADDTAKNIVAAIETKLKSFGYKDLELLENVEPDKMKEIVRSIDWTMIPGVKQSVQEVEREIDLWFNIAKQGFQELYERRMKLWSFVLSAIVVILLDANLFKVYREFSVDTPLRKAVITWAEKSIPDGSSSQRENMALKSPDTLQADSSGGKGMTTSPAGQQKSSESLSDAERIRIIRAQADSIHALLSSDALSMLGWRSGSYKGAGSINWGWNWIGAFFGWLGMTLLVSLGAPFWYDILKTLMGIKEKLNQSPAKSDGGGSVVG